MFIFLFYFKATSSVHKLCDQDRALFYIFYGNDPIGVNAMFFFLIEKGQPCKVLGATGDFKALNDAYVHAT